MILVAIPAHNEEASIDACLQSVGLAASHPLVAGERVEIVVALDRCTDATEHLVRARGARSVVSLGGNVGAARAAAVEEGLALGAQWIACTDADSTVPCDWLAAQLQCGTEAFCGIVQVKDWQGWPACVIAEFLRNPPVDGHPHVHGANLGVSAHAYRAVGGFRALSAHEDVDLVRRLEQGSHSIARLATPVVTTSARRDSRAREGFADHLKQLERRLIGESTPIPPLPEAVIGNG